MILQNSTGNIQQQKQVNSRVMEQQKAVVNEQPVEPNAYNQPMVPELMFIPPPLADSSKYLDHLQSQLLQVITKDPSSLQYLTIFGEKRPINFHDKKLPEPIFIDKTIKQKMKKTIKSIYEKMIQNLKYCAGEMPINHLSPLPKISQKSYDFMLLCQQLKVAETKSTIWRIMQQQTQQMNKKSEEIEKFIESMTEYCQNQQKMK